jgi:predicted ATPase
LLGFPEAGRTDIEHALKYARAIGQAATLMHTLAHAFWTHFWIGAYTVADTLIEEGIALSNEKAASMWEALGMMHRGVLLASTDKAADGVPFITSAMKALRRTGTTLWMPSYLSYLARAYAELDGLEDAWRCIREAMTAVESTDERWYEAEVNRTAGEIALKWPKRDTAKSEAYFQRALAVARQQQAKSWELRTAMSMARLWRDQGKRDEARELLAPVYGWFTEGFDTRDLKEAKALLEELAP